MNDITSLATKIEAAKIAGNGITLTNDELIGVLAFRDLFLDEVRSVLSVPPPSTEEDEVVTIDEVCVLLRITRQTLYRWRRDGMFTPKPINSQGTRWLRSQVLDWRREQKA